MIDSILSILLMNFSCCLLLVSILYLLFFSSSFLFNRTVVSAGTSKYTHTPLHCFIGFYTLCVPFFLISFHFISFHFFNIISPLITTALSSFHVMPPLSISCHIMSLICSPYHFILLLLSYLTFIFLPSLLYPYVQSCTYGTLWMIEVSCCFTTLLQGK